MRMIQHDLLSTHCWKSTFSCSLAQGGEGKYRACRSWCHSRHLSSSLYICNQHYCAVARPISNASTSAPPPTNVTIETARESENQRHLSDYSWIKSVVGAIFFVPSLRKAAKKWAYLLRNVQSVCLSACRNSTAAKRFFCEVWKLQYKMSLPTNFG
jgi:hypothetical protein